MSCHIPRDPSLLGQEVWADVQQPEQELGGFIKLNELFQVLPILKKEFFWNKFE